MVIAITMSASALGEKQEQLLTDVDRIDSSCFVDSEPSLSKVQQKDKLDDQLLHLTEGMTIKPFLQP